jgi:hypothetical protein
MVQLDHIVIRVDSLKQAVNDYRAMGFTIHHEAIAIEHTNCALIFFENGVYFMLLENSPHEVNDFSAITEGDEGLAGYAMRTNDIQAETKRLQGEGFAVGDTIEITQRFNQREIRWNIATIDGGFKPYLVQDVTPTEWRILTDKPHVTHANHAVRVPAVSYAVRFKNEPLVKDYIGRLTGQTMPEYLTGRRDLNFIAVDQCNEFHAKYTVEEYIDKMGIGLPKEVLAKADPEQEPASFAWFQTLQQERAIGHQRGVAREVAMKAALGDSDYALFGIDLVREAVDTELFTPERRHGVWFQHLVGASKERGADALAGIDEIDWSSVHHAYGSATDVPDLLRALASSNKAVRDHASEILMGNIWHQGSVYSASVEAIPFLARLIDAPDIDNEAPTDLIGYLTGACLYKPELQARTRALLDEVLPLFIKSLSNPDPVVRREMAEELRLYSWAQSKVEPLLKDKIMSDASHYVRATSLLSLITLWEANAKDKNDPELTSSQREYVGALLRNKDTSASVRYQASLFLVQNYPDEWLDEGVAFFYEIMTYAEHDLTETDHIRWDMIVWYDIPHALKKYPDIVLKWVITQADHKNADVRKGVVSALNELVANQDLPFGRVLPTMRQLIKDSSADVRLTSLLAVREREHVKEMESELRDLAKNDPSLMIRDRARLLVEYLEK